MIKLKPISISISIIFSCASATLAASPELPKIPDKVFRITDYGAVGDSATMNTKAIQAAIEACDKAGGGIVEVTKGNYLTAAFSLHSHINLKVDEGAKLLMSNNPSDYKLTNNRYENEIIANDCTDIAITGKGVIDGQGDPWWKSCLIWKKNMETVQQPPHRPYMVSLQKCKRVLVEDITLTNSPSFHLTPNLCRDVTIRNIKIFAPETSPNTDGIDPSGWNFLFTSCIIDVGDDCIAFKPGKPIEVDKPACRDMVVENCTFKHGHGLSIGGQTPGGMDRLFVHNCTFENTDAGIRMKAGRGTGGFVEDLTYKNITMKNVKIPILITSYYPKAPKDVAGDPKQPVDNTTPIWRNITIENVNATGAKTCGIIYGLPEMPVQDLRLKNVSISGKRGLDVVHAKNITLDHCEFTAEKGIPISWADAAVIKH